VREAFLLALSPLDGPDFVVYAGGEAVDLLPPVP
jgi:hypothetical protein